MWIRSAAFAILCSMTAALSHAAAAAQNRNLEEIWLAASLNGQQSDEVALFLRTPAGRILAPAAQLKAWRMRSPVQAVMSHDGEQYVPLDALSGLTYHVDDEKQVLVINAPARLFDTVSLSLSASESERPAPPPFGGFLNYNFVAAKADSRANFSGTLEASMFGPAGAGVTEYLVRHESQLTRAIRLDSTWTIDHPDTASSFRFGDSISGVSAWGGAVRFGGVQLASNYTTRPGLITMPLPGIAGEAVLPSTLNVYVNNMLRLQSSLPTGPFRVDDVPVITGQGDIELVVRDVLGRQRVISQPYYSSPNLLRAGLQEYSFEAGFIRDNFGLTSNDYGRPLVVATDRVGLTDYLTGEVHGEALKEQQTFGVSGSTLLSTLGVLDVSVAGSHSQQGAGHLVSLGFQHSARWLSLGATVEHASQAFVRVGMLPNQPTPRLTSQLFASAGMGRLGSLSISRTREDYYGGQSLEILSARHSINVGWLGYLSFSVIRTSASTSDTTVALGLVHAMDARTSFASTTASDTSGATEELDLQRNLPAGRGIGYRLIADEGALRAVDGTVDLQDDTGTYEFEAREQYGSTLTQVSAAGGVALLGGHVFPTRTIDQSFAVVQVGSENGVRVYRENQLVGTTDAQGYALVPGLRAYQDNSIRIEQADIPLDIVVNTVQSQAVPYYRSGVLVSFPVENPHGALLSVNLEDGKPLPAGAVVTLPGVQEEFPTGLNGEVYVTGLGNHNELLAQWNGAKCRFSVPYTPSAADPLPHLGPFTCKRVEP